MHAGCWIPRIPSVRDLNLKSVSLFGRFEHAWVQNFAKESVRSFWEQIDFYRGGGSVNLPPNVPFQGGGASTGQAILVLPPGHSNYDFVKLSYFNLDLDPTRAWSFQTRIGIQQANNTAAGVRFQVVVGGDRKQPFNTPRASTPGSRCGRRTSSHVREVSLPSAGRART